MILRVNFCFLILISNWETTRFFQKSIKKTEREVKKNHVYAVAPSIGASVPGDTSTVPDPLRPTIDVSVSDV